MKKLMLMTSMIVLTGIAGFTQAFEKGAQAIIISSFMINLTHMPVSGLVKEYMVVVGKVMVTILKIGNLLNQALRQAFI
jgi:hypothetical protein